VLEIRDIARRVEKLEKQNRCLKQLWLAALIAAASVLVMGQARTKRTVEANEFVLKDGNGKARAKLLMADDDFSPVPELILVDEKRVTRVKLHDGGPADFSGIMIFDKAGRERGAFDADESGAALPFMNVKGTDEALIRGEGITLSGPVTVVDRQGYQATLGTTALVTSRTGETHETSAASLVLFDKGKNVIWKAP
jgi:hypothetical protein